MTTPLLANTATDHGMDDCGPGGPHHDADTFSMGNDSCSDNVASSPGQQQLQQQQQQQQGQQQSESNNTNVQSVVEKARLASAFLWTLLHAKNCRLGVNTCLQRGCAEAKLVLLHLKTCPAASFQTPCPTNHKGCAQARKLLAHYDTCRERRQKRVRLGEPPPSQQFQPSPPPPQQQQPQQQDQHFCLVCSMVARHARHVLDSSTTTNAKPLPSTHPQQVISVSRDSQKAKEPSTTTESTFRNMPPPPPRKYLFCSGTLGTATATTNMAMTPSLVFSSSQESAATTATASPIPVVSDSPPPSDSLLMSVATVASLVQPTPIAGNSLTIINNINNNNSDQHHMDIAATTNLEELSEGLLRLRGSGVDVRPCDTSSPTSSVVLPRRRKRAETLDWSALSAAQPLLALRHHHHHHHHQRPPLQFSLPSTQLFTDAVTSTTTKSTAATCEQKVIVGNDPTLEMVLVSAAADDSQREWALGGVEDNHNNNNNVEDELDEEEEDASAAAAAAALDMLPMKRPRSLSCSVIGSKTEPMFPRQHPPPAPQRRSRHNTNDTIMEESSLASKDSSSLTTGSAASQEDALAMERDGTQ